MNLLVVKKDMRTEGCQDIRFRHAAKEEGLVHADAPVPQRLDRPLVGRRASRSDQGCADGRLLTVNICTLQIGERHQEVRKGALIQGHIRLLRLMSDKGVQATLLEDALTLSGEENCVAVKCDADLPNVPLRSRMLSAGKDHAGSQAAVDSLFDIWCVSRQEQIRPECLQVRGHFCAANEGRARNVEAIMTNRAEYPQGCVRCIAAHDDDLHRPLLLQPVQVQERLYQRESRARRQDLTFVCLLIIDICQQAILFEYLICLFKVKQRTGRDADDQGLRQIVCHMHTSFILDLLYPNTLQVATLTCQIRLEDIEYCHAFIRRQNMQSRSHDFSIGPVRSRILQQALPLTLAQIVQLLYNVVDRIYIGHLPEIGDVALTGLGITFPVIVIIAAFTALFGQGGTPLFSIARGRGDEVEAEKIIGNVFALLTSSAAVLFVFCYVLRRPILYLFGASDASFVFADEYLQIYLFGTLFSMLTTGMNGYINAQGFPRTGMATTIIGALINIALDPLFIFTFHMGVRGAALATIISQAFAALWVMRFLTGRKAILRLKREHVRISMSRTLRIVNLGLPGFVMQGTNSLVQIVCNTQLQMAGGDLYVGVMTIIGSVREILSLPVGGISSGAQPVLGFNYGAGKFSRVKEGIRFMSLLGVAYTALAWVVVMLIPAPLLKLFGCDGQAIATGAEMMNIYFFGFVFMSFQFVGQSTFQGLGKARKAIFFSLLRKAFIVVPLTLLLPRWFGVRGVFLAEPVSNAIGGLACFLTMWFTLYRRLPEDS